MATLPICVHRQRSVTHERRPQNTDTAQTHRNKGHPTMKMKNAATRQANIVSTQICGTYSPAKQNGSLTSQTTDDPYTTKLQTSRSEFFCVHTRQNTHDDQADEDRKKTKDHLPTHTGTTTLPRHTDMHVTQCHRGLVVVRTNVKIRA